MAISFSEFISIMFSQPLALVIVLLNFGVILVNGWTDAPNAIATCVSTRALSPRKSILLATVFNFLGVIIMTIFNANVATTIYKMVDFSGDTGDALLALAAAMFAIVVWATAAWLFGIPTSESHSLIAGISGAAIALQGGIGGINPSEWVKVIYGLFLSTGMGFGLGWINSHIINRICRNMDYKKADNIFGKAQIGAAAGMAFMHGAQDGQKFMGIFLLGLMLSQGQADTTNLVFPIWMMVLCSLIMALGTSMGGMRIIKSVGMKMVHLKKYQGFTADLSGVISLFIASILGLPVSTTHTKTTAIMGVGSAKRISAVNWGVVKEMVLAWILTFPGCGLIGYLTVKLFMAIF
jgi:PiT family inorganic phosphate transporter